jgi:hypothetical protein
MGRELTVDAFETGFGWIWYVYPLCLSPSSLDIADISVENADVDSGQDESVWSKFPSWFLQDTLLGFFELRRSQDCKDRWREHWSYFRSLCQEAICTLHPLEPYCMIASYICLALYLPLATLPRVY